MTSATGATATCPTCPRHCRLAPGQTGFCRARANVGGQVACVNYGRLTSLALDPIEKKPIAFWRPGSLVLSAGSFGCTMACPFCQNFEISQAGASDIGWREVSPQELVDKALDLQRRDPRVVGLAYTYNEPLASWEYVRDCSRLAHEHELANVLVSSGNACDLVVAQLEGLIDAANIDLKAATQEGYDRLGGSLSCVKQTIARLAADPACHLEVTTLVVPGLSDADEDVDAMALWLASLDPAIPYHLTRFFPRYRMSSDAPTPLASLHRLKRVAERHLTRVLLGNV